MQSNQVSLSKRAIAKERTLSFFEYFHVPQNVLISLALISLVFLTFGNEAMAQGISLPGSDQSDKLQQAGVLLRLADTIIFKWATRFMAGLLIVAAGLALKRHEYGTVSLCVAGAVVVGTASKWVANIFEFGGGTLFSVIENAHTWSHYV